MRKFATSSWWAIFGIHCGSVSSNFQQVLVMKTLLLLLAVCLVSLPCHARDFTFTVMVEAGKSDCFYDYIHKGAFLEIEYQVCLLIQGLGKLELMLWNLCRINWHTWPPKL